MFIASRIAECDLRQRTAKLPLFWEGIDVGFLSNNLEVTWSGKHPSYLFFWEGIDVGFLSNNLEVTCGREQPSYLFFGRALMFIASRIA